MYACICNALKEREVRRVAPDCATTLQVYRALGCQPQCGRCGPTLRGILAESRLDAVAAQSPALVMAAE